MSDLQLHSDVRAALQADPRVRAKDIAVTSQAGVVTLRGTVASLRQRHAAIATARSVTGVRSVYDLLKVRLLPGDPRDDEIRAAALESLIGDPRIRADQIDVEVAAGWLTLKGQVDDQSDSDAALQDVRGVEGVGGISNEIRVVTAP